MCDSLPRCWHGAFGLIKSYRRAHITELNSYKPKQPFFFLKPPSSIVLSGDGPLLRPKGIDMHYEVELALVIGKQVRDLKPDDTQGALEAIKGS